MEVFDEFGDVGLDGGGEDVEVGAIHTAAGVKATECPEDAAQAVGAFEARGDHVDECDGAEAGVEAAAASVVAQGVVGSYQGGIDCGELHQRTIVGVKGELGKMCVVEFFVGLEQMRH